jgi:hypothetical protein
MFSKVPERQMHKIRMLLTSSWLILIFSLFYDPILPKLTEPNNTLSPLRIHPEICVQVQGVCLEETPYALGAPIFWGAVVPSGVFLLLMFGSQLWRRSCPLSFMSQLPRALGWQRQQQIEQKNGKTRYEIIKIKKDSWLGQNYLYLQFSFLYLGVCSRILFINSNRLALGLFLIFTILSAISIGYLYGGKTWCQYFCPMAPVEKIFSEPRGLLTKDLRQGTRPVITQSMCRIVTKEGIEQSACVGCQLSCIDIDAERSYWDKILRADHKFLYYSYMGLVVGYFFYYYLYSGNWNYYFSGAWAHEKNQLATLLSPGFYVLGHPIGIPKLLAVPLTLGFFSSISYFLGRKLETSYKNYLLSKNPSLDPEQIQHWIFTICTFVSFNFFFVFAGRSFICLLPWPVQYLYNLLLVVVSTLWLDRTWGRSPDRFLRDSLFTSLRRKLSQLRFNLSQSS